jgi:hypothetical protein
MTAVAKATTVRTMPVLIKTVNAIHAKAIQADDKAADLWITLGIELKEAKARNKEMDGVPWPEFAKLHFNFGQSRADELIRIADGRTNVDEVREEQRAKNERHQRKIKASVSNAGSLPTLSEILRQTSKAMAVIDDDAPNLDNEYLDDDVDKGDPSNIRTAFALRVDLSISAAKDATKLVGHYREAKAVPGAEFVEWVDRVLSQWKVVRDELSADITTKSKADRAETKTTKSIGNTAIQSAADRAEAKSRARLERDRDSAPP